MKSFLAALPFALISFNDINTLDSKTVTVSGLSSGAMMASQMLISNSAHIQGAALIAGGPFACAENSLSQAFECIDHPEKIDINRLTQITRDLDQKNLIDSVQNLKNKFVYIFNGKNDSVVQPESGPKSLQYFLNFLPLENIKTEFSINSGHGLATINRGNSCEAEKAPWINSCNYDSVQNFLEFLLHKKLLKSNAKAEHLYEINFSGLIDVDSNINNVGLVYVPENCKKSFNDTSKTEKCNLHVVFHGCRQTLDEAGLDFIQLAGYNDWAEKNNLVILYPNIIKTFFNPKGCWDWWGYTTSNYANKNGPQIRTINRLIKKLTSP